MKILEVTTLTKYFGGVAALKNVTFDIPEKQICGFIGPNGAGKTTLFSVITGAQRPSSGKVHFRGGDVTGLDSASLVKKGVARTHQVVRPFKDLTVLENVQLAVHYGRRAVTLTSAAKEHAMETLETGWPGSQSQPTGFNDFSGRTEAARSGARAGHGTRTFTA